MSPSKSACSGRCYPEHPSFTEQGSSALAHSFPNGLEHQFSSGYCTGGQSPNSDLYSAAQESNFTLLLQLLEQ